MKKSYDVKYYLALFLGISSIIIVALYIIPHVISGYNYINAAGRQRELTQKMLMDVYLIEGGKKMQ